MDDGIRTYAYNSAGRITSINNEGVSIANVYNPLGQRIVKSSGDAKTVFVYDEQGLLIGEYDQANNPTREYVYLNGLSVAMFSEERPNEVLQIHTDHLGTPRAATDKANSVLWRMEGDQFGDAQPSIELVKLPLRHAGQYEDKETGLFYNWHRFYDPAMGRYVTSDPLGLYDGLNPYIYVHNNPLAMVDPDGLRSTVSVGITGLVQLGIFPQIIGFGPALGGGTLLGLSIPDNLIDLGCYQVLLQFNAYGGVGIGSYAGVGLSAGYSKLDNNKPLPPISSSQTAPSTQVNAGFGPSGGISYGSSDGGKSVTEGSIAGGRIGVGVGLQTSVGASTTTTIATKTWSDDCECK